MKGLESLQFQTALESDSKKGAMGTEVFVRLPKRPFPKKSARCPMGGQNNFITPVVFRCFAAVNITSRNLRSKSKVSDAPLAQKRQCNSLKSFIGIPETVLTLLGDCKTRHN